MTVRALMHPVFRSFRHRNFRVFYSGQFVSVLGSWMQTVATSWLVYRLSGSAFLLGLTDFAQQIPFLVLAPIAGVVADRADRRRLLMIIQSAALVQATVLAVLTFSGLVAVWHVVGLAFVLGVCNAFEAPTRQTFLLEMVERPDLPNAIALQSFLMNTTRLVGPSIGGVILAFAGEAWCFTLNAVSYLAIVAAYARLRIAAVTRHAAPRAIARDLIEGFRYAYGSLVMRRLLILLAALGFFSAPWQSLLPIFVAEHFGGESLTLGFMIGAVGAGALVGTVYLAGRATVRGLGRVIAATSLTAGIGLVVFSCTQYAWQAFLVLPVFGFGLIVTAASTNQILQTVAEDRMRGRVVSIYIMTFLGLSPLGNFVAGSNAQAIGAPWALTINGLCLTLVALWFIRGFPAWRDAVRPIYDARGVVRDRVT